MKKNKRYVPLFEEFCKHDSLFEASLSDFDFCVGIKDAYKVDLYQDGEIVAKDLLVFSGKDVKGMDGENLYRIDFYTNEEDEKNESNKKSLLIKKSDKGKEMAEVLYPEGGYSICISDEEKEMNDKHYNRGKYSKSPTLDDIFGNMSEEESEELEKWMKKNERRKK